MSVAKNGSRDIVTTWSGNHSSAAPYLRNIRSTWGGQLATRRNFRCKWCKWRRCFDNHMEGEGGLGGVTFATWQPFMVSFPTVEETGVALETTTSAVETGGAMNAVMYSTWSFFPLVGFYHLSRLLEFPSHPAQSSRSNSMRFPHPPISLP